MTAPFDSTPAAAEFDPTLVQVAAVSVALPPAGARSQIAQPTGDAARVQLGAGTEFAQVCVYRQGDALMVTAQGYGQLVIQNTPTNNPNAPEIADTHGQVVRAESIGTGCGAPGGGVAALGDVAPAAGGGVAGLAAIAPAAGPAAAGAAAGDGPTGGHFNSTFDPSQFLGLNYGPVDPLRFDRGPPVLTQGPGADNPGEPPFTPPANGVDSLDIRSNSATADIAIAGTPPTWIPVGSPISSTDLINNEGHSVYTTGNGGLVGAPDAANVHLQSGADVTISLINENAAFQNITGYYTFDAAGHITGAQMLWLNSAPDGLHTEADFYGKTGDLTQTFHVSGDTNLGFFLISDGGGDGSHTTFGTDNKVLFNQLFASLGIDPTTLPDSNAIMDVVNQHLRFDAASGTIQIDVDGNPANGAVGWTSLAGFEYYSHNSTLDTDHGQSNLSAAADTHVVSGVDTGALVVGFEDLPFIGVTSDPNAPSNFTPGPGYPAGVIAPDFDYNDTLLDVRVTYTPVEIAPGVWSPLTAIDNSLNNGAGAITSVNFTVAGLGDGVSLNNFASLLSAGWSLTNSGLDANGNGTYSLHGPGGTASSAAFVAELAKLQIDVSENTPTAHGNVTIDFTATDAAGLTDNSHSVLNFASAGTAPPAPPEVHVDAGALPPASPHIEQLITT